MHTQLHPQVEASLLLPSVHDDSATTQVTRTTVTACQTDKKLVSWAHALRESKIEAINVKHSGELQMAVGFLLRELQ